MLRINRLNRNKRLLLKAENQLQDLQNEIESAKSYISHIEAGNLDAPYPGLENEQVEEGTLSESLISMKEKLKALNVKEDQRKWITEGLNKFMVILRQQEHENITETCEQIISQLIKYIGANQGGIYIANHEKEVLELTAFYAYDRKKFLEQAFHFGEGLIGQVYLEKETQLFKKVPKDYIRITSGLGDAPPQCILIVPLKINNEVNGILEIASFNIFEAHQIEFLEKLGEYIASSVETLKKNSQTNILLRKSQSQANQLRAQEEEIKQNMEEMQATQEELARKEAESQSIITTLNNSYYVAEINLAGEILNINHLLKDIISEVYHTNHIKGENYGRFSKSQEINLDDILAKTKNSETQKRTSFFELNEQKLWFSEVYSPVYNAQKKVLKILMVASNITNEILQRKELEKKSTEIADIREKEKARTDHSIKAQTKMMEKFMEKAKQKEQALNNRIKELESTLNKINH